MTPKLRKNGGWLIIRNGKNLTSQRQGSRYSFPATNRKTCYYTRAQKFPSVGTIFPQYSGIEQYKGCIGKIFTLRLPGTMILQKDLTYSLNAHELDSHLE